MNDYVWRILYKLYAHWYYFEKRDFAASDYERATQVFKEFTEKAVVENYDLPIFKLYKKETK